MNRTTRTGGTDENTRAKGTTGTTGTGAVGTGATGTDTNDDPDREDGESNDSESDEGPYRLNEDRGPTGVTSRSTTSGRSKPRSGTEQSVEDTVESAEESVRTARQAVEEGEFDRAVVAWEDARDAYETALDRAETTGDYRVEGIRDRLEDIDTSLDAAVDRRDAAERLDDLLSDAADLGERAETAVGEAEYETASDALDRARDRLDTAGVVAGGYDLPSDAIDEECDRLASIRERLDEKRTTGPPETVPRAPALSLSYDRFADRESIVHGGNADVYRAVVETPDGDVTVAVKEPRVDGTLYTETVDRLLEEAETWDRLDDHDHVVGVVDYGSEPLPWIAMEYMDAGHLGERVGDLSLDQALWTAVSVCEAVRHAHRHGVAHLDLKPANVLFRRVEGAWDVPKVADWGLSKHLLEHSKSVEGLSPQYAAPEQFDEDRGPTDDITDVYQLGAVFYELFTGVPVFDGQPADVMHKVLSAEPTPPSELADVPAALDDVLLRALATERADRYESVLYLRDDLQELSGGL